MKLTERFLKLYKVNEKIVDMINKKHKETMAQFNPNHPLGKNQQMTN